MAEIEKDVNVEEVEEVKNLELQDTFNEDPIDVLCEDAIVENVDKEGEE